MSLKACSFDLLSGFFCLCLPKTFPRFKARRKIPGLQDTCFICRNSCEWDFLVPVPQQWSPWWSPVSPRCPSSPALLWSAVEDFDNWTHVIVYDTAWMFIFPDYHYVQNCLPGIGHAFCPFLWNVCSYPLCRVLLSCLSLLDFLVRVLKYILNITALSIHALQDPLQVFSSSFQLLWWLLFHRNLKFNVVELINHLLHNLSFWVLFNTSFLTQGHKDIIPYFLLSVLKFYF